jgi:hypothetical protein
MCAKTNGGTDNLSNGQHQLPTDISIFHSTAKNEIGYLPGNSDTSNLDRGNLGEVKRSASALANEQFQNRRAYAFEMIPIPAPAMSRPTVSSLYRQLYPCTIYILDLRRASNDDHLQDHTDSQQDDSDEKTTFSARIITKSCQFFLFTCDRVSPTRWVQQLAILLPLQLV